MRYRRIIATEDHGFSMFSPNGSKIEPAMVAQPRPIYKKPREVDLMRARRLSSNVKNHVDLEYICEEKSSRYRLEEIHTSLPSSMKSTFNMTFSPDGQRVASTHGDHHIYICDFNTGKLLDSLEGHPKTPWCLAWHPTDRNILASGCLAGEVRVWDLQSKACESWTSPSNTIIASLDFHPKERILVVATANDVHFWDWGESEPFAKTTTSHDKEKVKFVLFDSSGTKLITGISNTCNLTGTELSNNCPEDSPAANPSSSTSSSASSTSSSSSAPHQDNIVTSVKNLEPGTSFGSSRDTKVKRKLPNDYQENVDLVKKTKLERGESSRETGSPDTEMIEIPNARPSSSSGFESVTSGEQYFRTNLNSNRSYNVSADHSPSSHSSGWNSNGPGDLVGSTFPRLWFTTASNINTNQMIWRICQRLHGALAASGGNPLENSPVSSSYPAHESRRRALSQDNGPSTPNHVDMAQASNFESTRGRPLYISNFVLQNDTPANSGSSGGLSLVEPMLRNSFVHFYQARPHHIWFNHWTIPLSVSVSNSNYRLQCWDLSLTTIPNIKDARSNVVTQKCRIHNDSSVDISSDGRLIACLVPRDDACVPCLNLKIFSLRSNDFGVCYHQWLHGPNAITVSLSPSAKFVVVGLASNKFISNDPNEDDLTIAKVFKLEGGISQGYVRDIKVKRNDSTPNLNAIRWLTRGIVYSIGPQHHQRYTARPRNRAT